MNLDTDDSWSDTSDEDEADHSLPIQSRAYQIEMFEHSMKGNIIAVMSTGSGKTQVAKLRIEAELLRTPGKRVWFTAPSVVLAYQQHSFLSRQLPAFQFRLITGMDNAEFWDTQEIWDKALHNVHAIVCTPAILLQALNAGFVTMKSISLLVVDEAHHCVARSVSNSTMQLHYHPLKKADSAYELPHILGLSASPITKKDPKEIIELEVNLDATCKAPLKQLEEYTGFVNTPQLEFLTFTEQLLPFPEILTGLSSIVSSLQVTDDPIMTVLRERGDTKAQEKLEKIWKRKATPAMIELQSFERSAITIHEQLGPWASGTFITACIRKLHTAIHSGLGRHRLTRSSYDNLLFMDTSLQPLHGTLKLGFEGLSAPDSLSSKVNVLVDFLERGYREDLRGLIFVQARHSAWALTEIINHHPAMRNYQAFSFVGVSNAAHQSSFDFAQLHVQNENLERFRRGELNLCVATAVLEEGVDVPAMNLVICFDERPNLRSYVQSRGRARQQDSKFVILRSEFEGEGKIKKWQILEKEVKKECESSQRDLEELQRMESATEPDGPVFRLQSTGATLTFDNARQLLQRFCAKLPKKDKSEVECDAAFCLQGEVGIDVSATVYLPTSLPPKLQVAHSRSSWCTEKMAKRDAAFQAYLALYNAGLVTENLQPMQWAGDASGEEDAIDNRNPEKRESFYAVKQQYNPWLWVMELWTRSHTLYGHRLRVKDCSGPKPDLILILPLMLSGTEFPLYNIDSEPLQVSVVNGEELSGYPVDLARETSLYMFTTVLGRRLQGFHRDQFPFLLVPDLDQQSLRSWYEGVSSRKPLTDLGWTIDSEEFLVLMANEHIPYVFEPGLLCQGANAVCNDGIPTISVTKLSRRLELLSPPTVNAPVDPPLRWLPVNECTALGLPVTYARLMLLVPSITHMLEVSLRTTAACNGPLASLAFKDIDMVSEALTLPRVGTRNYQRLEFLGDDLLKFYASMQVFVDHPDHPESLLTMARSRIISNARLQRATRILGLDQFLTQHRFSGSKWTAGISREAVSDEPSAKTHLSSKVLADVVEALIGAASLDTDDKSNGQSQTEEKVIRALRLFIDEVPWRPLSANLDKIPVMDDSQVDGVEVLRSAESLIGYTFKHHALLAEALTQSWLGGQVLSYDRLEFLGDAVLDHIVKTKLFRSPLNLDPEQMTLRRHALVSHATLAFFAFQASYACSTFELVTDPFTRRTADRETTRTVYLFDHVRRIGSRQDAVQRETALAAYHDVRDGILHAFKHGRKFPWTELLHIGAPKMYSDVIESVLGAVFVDSLGDLGACKRFLQTMGFMDLVDRFASEPDHALDLRHPEELLSQVQPGCQFFAREKRHAQPGAAWRCKVLLNGERIAHAKKASCKDEAQCRAAERAVDVLSKKRKRETEMALPSMQVDAEDFMVPAVA